MIIEKTLKTTGTKQKKRYISFGLKEDFEDGLVIVQHKEEYYLQQEAYKKLQEENTKLKKELNSLNEDKPKENNVSLIEELKSQKKEEINYLKGLIEDYKNDNKELQEKVQTLTEKNSSERSNFIIILSSLANENPIQRLFSNKAKQVITELKNNENYLQDKKVFQTIEASEDSKEK